MHFIAAVSPTGRIDSEELCHSERLKLALRNRTIPAFSWSDRAKLFPSNVYTRPITVSVFAYKMMARNWIELSLIAPTGCVLNISKVAKKSSYCSVWSILLSGPLDTKDSQNDTRLFARDEFSTNFFITSSNHDKALFIVQLQNDILSGATLKAGMTERRNGGITERRKITPNPKRRSRGITERRKIPPNPKRRNHGTAENTPKS